MIEITQTEENVFKAYNVVKNTGETSAMVRKKNDTVCRMLRKFVDIGLMKKEGRFYVPTGAQYRIVTFEQKVLRKTPDKVQTVPMTEFERKWMLENYKPRKRGLAAQILGRTRTDICLMAIELKLDVDGRWDEHAKNNKGRSA